MYSRFRKVYTSPTPYVKYAGWSFVSNIAISAQSVLSTHSMLSVIGRADSEIVASVNYIGKDIIGQALGLFYMHKQGKEADTNTRRFLNRSLFLQQAGIFMESATPMLSSGSFIAVGGFSNMIKNISFTGFGAVNAKIIQRISGTDRIGETYSQIAMLNTIGSTLGMCAGLALAVKIPSHTIRMYTVLPILGVITCYAYRKAVEDLI